MSGRWCRSLPPAPPRRWWSRPSRPGLTFASICASALAAIAAPGCAEEPDLLVRVTRPSALVGANLWVCKQGEKPGTGCSGGDAQTLFTQDAPGAALVKTAGIYLHAPAPVVQLFWAVRYPGADHCYDLAVTSGRVHEVGLTLSPDPGALPSLACPAEVCRISRCDP